MVAWLTLETRSSPCRRSRSNRCGTGRGVPKIWGKLGPRPLGKLTP